MGLVKTRRLAAMQKQQRSKAGMKLLTKGGNGRMGFAHQSATAPSRRPYSRTLEIDSAPKSAT